MHCKILVTATAFCLGIATLHFVASAQEQEESPGLRNLRFESEKIATALAQLEADARAGKVNPDKIRQRRMFGMNFHFVHILQGSPLGGECESCKSHPTWLKVRDAYRGFETRMHALEQDRLKCTWGLLMEDGQVQKPDVSWSFEQYRNLTRKAAQQQMKCWKQSDKP